jgi:hypothetical protein
MKEHFYGDPVCKPSYKGGNKGYQDQPIVHQGNFGKVNLCE